ncbi:Arm DNA-binding domain-containing protein [Flagellimonas sp. CMM7]|uniref:Arm DNA-binding domain-containing protein n=1 Tax=Flagellimonas sp. CMM7 TaxID=2654676 RepID=UPI0013CFDD4B|nr:Arm DNA-binding domain-containing protein [Flagellimonas sp. CMM7]UII80396.1 Arm DNA-binding domain-containing protein [Flagellimonas sp. CMM7]
MARIKLVLDTRESSKRIDGTFPISLRVYNRKTRLLKVGHYTSTIGWDSKNYCLKKSQSNNKRMDFEDVNSDLEDKLYIAKKVLRE